MSSIECKEYDEAAELRLRKDLKYMYRAMRGLRESVRELGQCTSLYRYKASAIELLSEMCTFLGAEARIEITQAERDDGLLDRLLEVRQAYGDDDAADRYGVISTEEVARTWQLSIQEAQAWLDRLCQEGRVKPVGMKYTVVVSGSSVEDAG